MAVIIPTREVLELHRELEIKHGDGDSGNFISGWQCENPFSSDFLLAVNDRSSVMSRQNYTYMEGDGVLSRKIKELHLDLDGRLPKSLFSASGGSSSVIFTFCTLLARRAIKEVFYIPPIYFSMLNALRLFGIKAHAISSVHSFEQSFSMRLPAKEVVLILADPVWYVGLPLKLEIFDQLRQWQNQTKSLIFIDGSFQYMRWDEDVVERTSELDSSRTIMLVCQTKSLAIHGYRFAYALLPDDLVEEFSITYTNIYASGSADNIAFAHEAIDSMKSRYLTNQVVKL